MFRTATFQNAISADAGNNAYIQAIINTEETEITECPSKPTSNADCENLNTNCYYLNTTANYNQNIEVDICGKNIYKDQDKDYVIINFTNIINNNSYSVGNARCHIRTTKTTNHKVLRCKTNSTNTNYKFKQLSYGKNPQYKIFEDS